jgi:hypothetical protein
MCKCVGETEERHLSCVDIIIDKHSRCSKMK